MPHHRGSRGRSHAYAHAGASYGHLFFNPERVVDPGVVVFSAPRDENARPKYTPKQLNTRHPILIHYHARSDYGIATDVNNKELWLSFRYMNILADYPENKSIVLSAKLSDIIRYNLPLPTL